LLLGIDPGAFRRDLAGTLVAPSQIETPRQREGVKHEVFGLEGANQRGDLYVEGTPQLGLQRVGDGDDGGPNRQRRTTTCSRLAEKGQRTAGIADLR
jgi:hypothetical protein